MSDSHRAMDIEARSPRVVDIHTIRWRSLLEELDEVWDLMSGHRSRALGLSGETNRLRDLKMRLEKLWEDVEAKLT